MVIQNESLPESVREALHRGETIEAIRRLSDATELGLKESMDVIDGHLKRRPTTSSGASSVGQLPASVVEAMQRGDKIEAIKQLRKERGIGLKEAKDAVEAVAWQAEPLAGGHSTRRKAGANNTLWWLIVIALAGYAIYHFSA